LHTRVEPIALERDADGTPFAPTYGDVYHARAGAFAQARHVFLGGNDLPARWAGRAAFTILETGFGLGTNFLATWQAWRDDPERPARLHFVSIEKHPIRATDLLDVHADVPGIGPLARAVARQWPLPLPGLHRLDFEDDRVTLTLAFGDISDVLPALRLGADAFYLDGFAPARNPAMWSAPVLRSLGRLARDGATCATWTVARDVLDGLRTAGFVPEKRPGFATKREMLAARFAPAYRVRRHAPPAVVAWPERSAVVVGAGLAGAHTAAALARRGWRVTVVDRHATPAAETSANPAGALHPVVTRDDSVLARLSRAGFFLARRVLDRHPDAALAARCGFIECAVDAGGHARQRATAEMLGFPPQFVRCVDAAEASVIVGQPVAHGGLWYPEAGWVRPARLCATLLAAHDARVRFVGAREVSRLVAVDDGWRLDDATGAAIASAPVVVLAPGHGLAALAGQSTLRPDAVRGQLTLVPVSQCRPPATIVGGDGYCMPAIDGTVVVGASYDDDADPAPRQAVDDTNLARIAQLMPGFPGGAAPRDLAARVGFRSVAVDRLPVIGAALDEPAALADPAAFASAHCRDLPRRPGLHVAGALASRGLVNAALAGETIASLVEGEPPPIEGDLLDAIDPARLALRTRRRAR
jgi:tRNA 5-methylaminomethyl-2-thiouridine biosynthesis bifunctional protein